MGGGVRDRRCPAALRATRARGDHRGRASRAPRRAATATGPLFRFTVETGRGARRRFAGARRARRRARSSRAWTATRRPRRATALAFSRDARASSTSSTPRAASACGRHERRTRRRLEELGLNSSAPPGQLLYDGWLLRLAARQGQARALGERGLSVHAAARREDRLLRAALSRAAALPALFRITPFSRARRARRASSSARGYGTLRPDRRGGRGDRSAPGLGERRRASPWRSRAGSTRWRELRGSPHEHRAAHLARLEGMPLALRAGGGRVRGRRVRRHGLTIVEDDCAGLFDIVTRERRAPPRPCAHDRREPARARRWELGARHAYLQVQQDNEAARRALRASSDSRSATCTGIAAGPGEQRMTEDDVTRARAQGSGARAASASVMIATAESCTGGGVADGDHAHLRQRQVVRPRLRHLHQHRQGRDARRARSATLHALRRGERGGGARDGRRARSRAATPT